MLHWELMCVCVCWSESGILITSQNSTAQCGVTQINTIMIIIKKSSRLSAFILTSYHHNKPNLNTDNTNTTLSNHAITNTHCAASCHPATGPFAYSYILYHRIPAPVHSAIITYNDYIPTCLYAFRYQYHRSIPGLTPPKIASSSHTKATR